MKNDCESEIFLFGERYPCHLRLGHKGKHIFTYKWTNKEAELSVRRKQQNLREVKE